MFKNYKFLTIVALCVLILVVEMITNISSDTENRINLGLVQNWATKIGGDLLELSEFMTRRREVQESFKNMQVVNRSGSRLADEIAKEIKYMTDKRVNALKRIVKAAESIEFKYEPDEFYENFKFLKMREPDKSAEELEDEQEELQVEWERINKINTQNRDKGLEIEKWMKPKENDDICEIEYNEEYDPSITESSSVHLPIDIFDQDVNVTRIIHWSKGIDKTMIYNRDRDKELAWQYFCSFTGFMRQFPPSKWSFQPVDSFDCRIRNWYTMAANSPRDIIILLETSGSMTGSRILISKHVVRNILDTLTSHDYVNVLVFNEKTNYLIDCLQGLVEATSVNIHQLKLALEDINIKDKANIKTALKTSFKILEDFRFNRKGACCNQAIMLITDGLPYDLHEIFEKYNWRNKPDLPVRVFTYLIGEEIPDFDVDEVKLIACENQGYYVHIDTPSEVREQVLKYLSVMARPLVLNRNVHPITWTNIYADVLDPLITNQDWHCRQRENQYKVVLEYMKTRHKEEYSLEGVTVDELDDFDEDDEEDEDDKSVRKYVMMTSVSMPVFNKTANSSMLLGVCGIDVPVDEFKRLLKPNLIGVGGYAFIIDGNGNVLYHPDHRIYFQKNILKAGYTDVDMVEIEQMDDDRPPRDFNSHLLDIRDAIIEQNSGSKWMLAKQHLDDMMRVSRLRRHYYWTKIKETPFTVIVTYPESYGQFRAQAKEEEITKLIRKGSNIMGLFKRQSYKIHPEWMYCRNTTDIIDEIKLGNISDYVLYKPEDLFEFFIEKFERMGWQGIWISSNGDYECDQGLVQALIYDAKVTDWFPEDFFTKKDRGNELRNKFGVSLVFMATQSGLTRWKQLNHNIWDDFPEKNNKGIDEVWYRRAVEQINVDLESFVYSIPFRRHEEHVDDQVTVSHAIFQKDYLKISPVAAVGYRFNHTTLIQLVQSVIGNCPFNNCIDYCDENNLRCYVLDDNAYIVVSRNLSYHGKFFGSVESWLMALLVQEKIYREIVVFDYQGICYSEKNASRTYYDEKNFANHLITPFRYLWNVMRSMLISILNFIWILIPPIHGNEIPNLMYPESYDPPIIYNDSDHTRNVQKRYVIRTRPIKCDKKATLYKFNDKDKKIFTQIPADGCLRPFVISSIPNSNLVLLVADALCENNYESVHFDDHPINTTVFNETLHCLKQTYSLHKRQAKYCFNRTENLQDSCGDANKFQSSTKITVLAFVTLLYLNEMWRV